MTKTPEPFLSVRILKAILFYILYFVKGCGSFELNVLFGNTFHINWSISLEFFYHCYHCLKKILCPAEICFGLSSKHINLVESISNILVAAFCFANFFCGAGSPIHENVTLFFEISQLAWVVGSSGYIPSDFTIYVSTRNSTQCWFHSEAVLRYLSIGLFKFRPLSWSAKEFECCFYSSNERWVYFIKNYCASFKSSSAFSISKRYSVQQRHWSALKRMRYK